jgi:hypothetical protein
MQEKLKASRKSYARSIKKTYGLTLKQYDQMFTTQGGVCAICGEPELTRRLAVDHDHKTGEVRGLLCSKCNWKISVLDNADFVSKATEYLKINRTQCIAHCADGPGMQISP